MSNIAQCQSCGQFHTDPYGICPLMKPPYRFETAGETIERLTQDLAVTRTHAHNLGDALVKREGESAEANLRAESLRGEVARLNEELELVAAQGKDSYDALAVANAKIDDAWDRIFKDNPELQVNRVSLAMVDDIVVILSRDTPEGNNG